jgi:hypothetical protein
LNTAYRSRAFWAILAAALFIRCVVVLAAPFPGISDSNHYYNLARNLAQGRGFVVDYIWNYYNLPADVTHPEDYWMPLPAVYPAAMMALLPDSIASDLTAALLPGILFGTGITALSYALAAQAGLPHRARLLAMLWVAFIPELVLNSARTDTTITYVLYVGLACLCFARAYERGSVWWAGVGLFAGLAHLTRQDAILLAPALLVTIAALRLLGIRPPGWPPLAWVPLVWLAVLLPWMARNLALFGVVLAGGAGRTLFMTSFIDQFTYGRDLNFEHWWAWGPRNILANIAFQAAANVRMIFRLPTDTLALAGFAGLAGRWWARDVRFLRLTALPVVLLAGLFLFYSVVTPFHTQGGSFKKSAMLLLPFVAVGAAWVCHHWLNTGRAAVAATLVAASLMLMSAYELVRDDFDLAARFNASGAALAARLHELGDASGDGEIIVMTQDPFLMNYHGFRALMIPSDPLEMILEAARRYHVDYIILPAARPALDALYDNKEHDPRLRWLPGVENYQMLEVLAEPARR